MNATDHLQPNGTAVPWRLSASAVCSRKPTASAPYWANIKNRVDCITDVPPTHWRPEDYLDPDPEAPDRVYAAKGGFLDAVPFNPAAYGIAPSNLEATDTSQLLGLVATSRPWKTRAMLWTVGPASRAGPWNLPTPLGSRRLPPANCSTAAASASSSASPARWSWSSRGSAVGASDLAACIARGRRRAGRGRRRGAAHRRFLRRLAGEFVPRPAWQCGGRSDREPLRSRRGQLRRGRGLRSSLGHCISPRWSWKRGGPMWS